jgi:hypothetical protein
MDMPVLPFVLLFTEKTNSNPTSKPKPYAHTFSHIQAIGRQQQNNTTPKTLGTSK